MTEKFLSDIKGMFPAWLVEIRDDDNFFPLEEL